MHTATISVQSNENVFPYCNITTINIVVWQERQRVIYDEQKKLSQQQAQIKSQMARYEDELARKRMQACDLLLVLLYIGVSKIAKG